MPINNIGNKLAVPKVNKKLRPVFFIPFLPNPRNKNFIVILFL